MAIKLSEQQCQNLDLAMRREWLLTNGLGGFAMGTPSGINTRRYHGLLVAAVRPPTYRMVLLASMDAFIQTDGNPVGLSANQYPGAIYPDGYLYLRGFSVEPNVAVWRYKTAEAEIERKLIMHAGHNAITISYRNLGSRSVLLTLRPLVCHKFYHSNFGASGDYPQRLDYSKASTLVSHDGMDLTIGHPGARRSPVQGWYYRFEHVREAERGLDSRDDLYCPCELAYELAPGEQAIVTASDERETKPAESESSVAPRGSLADQLREAAGQFLVQTPARTSIISGYPWFTDWGRDTMVAIPGICLHTGRFAEARAIIDAFIGAMSEGLIPNRFVEEGEAPDNNTVDATLWMANALHRTLEAEWDEPFARRCLDALREVLAWHLKGTMHGIRVDPEDGLLTQGEPGLQLTWMDAKVGEWVVTPRHGKPVEVNGLWVNALRVGEWLASRLGVDGAPFVRAAEAAEASFDAKFWHEGRGHYLDTADPADASLRPNQLIAMSLPFGPAKRNHALKALEVVTRELLTPVGLRTLGPSESHYLGRFGGPLSELDAAYHQGTVWPWLLGPYISALVRLTGDRARARRVLGNAKEMLLEYGLGGISEVYDGDQPHQPGGCPWQAWSVAEILRAWIEDAQGEAQSSEKMNAK